MSCRLQSTSNGQEIECKFSPSDAVTVYFHPSNGPQRLVVNCWTADEAICFNEQGFILRGTSQSNAYISVPSNFSETGKFLCQKQDQSPESATSCLWPLEGNDASESSYAGSAALGYGITILVVVLVVLVVLAVLCCIKWPTIKLKIKTSKVWALFNKMYKKITREHCGSENLTNDIPEEREPLEKAREKIEDEMKTENYSDTIRAPACEPVRFRANIITSERMRKSKEDTVATEEAKDFISSSDIDMAMKTPVQVVSTNYGEEVKDTNMITRNTTVIEIHREMTEALEEEVNGNMASFDVSINIDTQIQTENKGIETTSANGANSDMQIQVESDYTEPLEDVEEDVFSFDDSDMDKQGEKESVFSLRQEMTVVKQATQNRK